MKVHPGRLPQVDPTPAHTSLVVYPPAHFCSALHRKSMFLKSMIFGVQHDRELVFNDLDNSINSGACGRDIIVRYHYCTVVLRSKGLI
jgi:hypothetical protein